MRVKPNCRLIRTALKTIDACKLQLRELNYKLLIALPLNGRNSINGITGNRFFGMFRSKYTRYDQKLPFVSFILRSSRITRKTSLIFISNLSIRWLLYSRVSLSHVAFTWTWNFSRKTFLRGRNRVNQISSADELFSTWKHSRGKNYTRACLCNYRIPSCNGTWFFEHDY